MSRNRADNTALVPALRKPHCREAALVSCQLDLQQLHSPASQDRNTAPHRVGDLLACPTAHSGSLQLRKCQPYDSSHRALEGSR
jgi:hypothetical protein